MTTTLPTHKCYSTLKAFRTPYLMCAFFIALFLFLFTDEIKAQIIVTYSNPGNYNFPVPCGLETAKVETWGAGGRGGRRTSTSSGTYAALGGGGGGAYTADNAFNTSTSDSFTVVVGAGGNTSGLGDGGTSSFGGLVEAYGGFTGEDRGGVAAGNGGVSGGGIGGAKNTNYANSQAGDDGENAHYTQFIFISRYGGNGGKGANGGNGGDGAPPSGNNNGSSGSAPGGGGGGSINGGTPGLGANGQVRITFSLTQPTISSETSSNIFCTGCPMILSVDQKDYCAATYTWKKDGETVGTGLTYVVNELDFEHAGVYTAEINIGSLTYENATITGSSPFVTINGNTISGKLTSSGFNVVVYDTPIFVAQDISVGKNE